MHSRHLTSPLFLFNGDFIGSTQGMWRVLTAQHEGCPQADPGGWPHTCSSAAGAAGELGRQSQRQRACGVEAWRGCRSSVCLCRPPGKASAGRAAEWRPGEASDPQCVSVSATTAGWVQMARADQRQSAVVSHSEHVTQTYKPAAISRSNMDAHLQDVCRSSPPTKRGWTHSDILTHCHRGSCREKADSKRPRFRAKD